MHPRAAARLLYLSFALASTAAVGCVADGTDLEGYPFVAIDKTQPRATHVTVPIGLSSYDEGGRKRIVRGPGGGGIDKKVPEDTTASKLQLIWPIATWTWEGRESEFRLFATLASNLAPTTPGPAGREIAGSRVGADPLVRPTSLFPNAVKGGVAFFPPLLGYDREHLDPRSANDPLGTENDLKHDFGLFPLFLGGNWPETGHWLALAPFGGVTHGFLGKEEMDWVGFPYPLYLYSRERAGDRFDKETPVIESHHVLWPLVNWVHGAGRDGFRIWPFYAHYSRVDLRGGVLAYDRHWVMWPFVSWATNSANQGFYDEEGSFVTTPTQELFVFPFYGRIHGPDLENTTVLWPFFRYQEVPSAGFWELRAPFPFFIMHHGVEQTSREGPVTERWRFDVWPLAGYRSRPYYVRHFFLWPIERFERRDDQWVDDTKFFLLPLFTYHHHHEKETQEDYQRTRVWPFVNYRRGVEGDMEIHALAPLLWEDPDGFERILYPFFRLYEYKETRHWRNDKGDERHGYQHRFLLGLASWRSEPRADGAEGGLSRLSLLFGLVQVRSGGTSPQEANRAGFRLFYLPEISWGGTE